jgi:hypothetical protein
MNRRWIPWLLYAALAAALLWWADVPGKDLLLALTIAAALARALPPHANPVLYVLKVLHHVPALFWLLWLAGHLLIVVGWLLLFQPAAGIPLSLSDAIYAVIAISAFNAFWLAGLTRDAVRQMPARMGWRLNGLIAIATVVIMMLGLELALRYLFVYSDNFALSKMHQNWVRVYWNPINTLGYRDLPPADGTTHRLLVMGDSFAAGYGVNDIQRTFPHLLGQQLGPGYSVNIAAQPGWGTGTARAAVQQYPYIPETLILSFFINDIVEGDAARVYTAPFPGVRQSPPAEWAALIDTFYIANFYYYRLYHYQSFNSGQRYLDWVLNAYEDEDVWRVYTTELDQVRDWAAANGVKLIAIVWGYLPDLALSAPATDRVVDYFTQHKVPVVNMAAVLAEEPAARLMVNVFDAHPSVYSHQRAADALYTLLAP